MVVGGHHHGPLFVESLFIDFQSGQLLHKTHCTNRLYCNYRDSTCRSIPPGAMRIRHAYWFQQLTRISESSLQARVCIELQVDEEKLLGPDWLCLWIEAVSISGVRTAQFSFIPANFFLSCSLCPIPASIHHRCAMRLSSYQKRGQLSDGGAAEVRMLRPAHLLVVRHYRPAQPRLGSVGAPPRLPKNPFAASFGST